MRNLFYLLLLSFSTITATAQPIKYLGFDFNTVGSSSPADLTVIGTNMFFSATTTLGKELWITNGMPNNGSMIKDIYAASPGSNPAYLTEMGGKLYFVADNGSVNGNEIWSSDGTDPGTLLLKDVVPGSLSSNPSALCTFGGKVYFIADTFFKGSELWCSDGTTPGTNLFKEINPGAPPCSFSNPIILGSKLLFTADNGVNGEELWYTDGTDTGTHMVKDIQVGSLGSFPRQYIPMNGKVYFSATIQGIPPHQYIYVTDGTNTGTTRVSNAVDIQNGFAIVLNNELYFSGITAATGLELYKTDGTSAGTVLVKEFAPGGGSGAFAAPCVYKNKIYFSGETPTEGKELWVTDGTGAGTTIIKDIIPGGNGSAPLYLTVYKDHLYFAAQDTLGNYQVFRSDGTGAGTQMIQPSTATVVSPVSAANGFKGFKEFNGSLFYTANYTITGSELWALTDTSVPINVHQIGTRTTDITIYPNPNHGSFIVQLPDLDFNTGTIALFDMIGKKQYESKLNNQSKNISVNPGDLAKGVYQLKVQLDNDVITKKLLIQ